MQNTSSNYKNIVSDPSHKYETKVSINGNEIGGDKIISLRRSVLGIGESKPTVGGALASSLELTVLTPYFAIPKMAEIDVFVRAKTASQTSEWIKQGVYFIDTRAFDETASGVRTLTVTAYDSMLKAMQDYPDASHDWPYQDKNVVAEIASAIGVAVDSRTNGVLTARYMIDLPIGYTMREVLQNIAASYGGNFVITADNKLLFVPLYGLDPDITGKYLADQNGNAIVFGNEGWCILV